MYVYINYPQPHFTIHGDVSCKEIQKQQKGEQRKISVTPANLKSILRDFIEEKYMFKADKEYNDLWFDIRLDSPEQEFGFVYVIQAIIGQRYSPFADAPVIKHC